MAVYCVAPQDIENAGLSAVVVTDGDEAQAAKLRDELLDMAWASRADWVFQHEPLSDSIARAQEMVCLTVARLCILSWQNLSP